MPSLKAFRSIRVVLVVCLAAFAFSASAILAKETERDAKVQKKPVVTKTEERRTTAPANTGQTVDSKTKPSGTAVKPQKPAAVSPESTPLTPLEPLTPIMPDQPVRDVNAGEQIKWQVISSGGSMNGASTNYRMSGTIGQTAVGPGTSTNYKINQGFWQNFSSGSAPSCCVGETGNVNGDGTTNLTDLTQMVNFLFVTFVPPACVPAANTNGDASCTLNLTDLTRLVNKLFVTFVPCAPCASFDNTLCP